MRIHSSVVAILSSLSHAILLTPTWTMTSSRNLTGGALQLTHPIADQSPSIPYMHITPSKNNHSGTDIPDDIWPSLPYPGFWTCPRDTVLPPNTEDCLRVITNTYDAYGNMTIDVPADRCIQASYRSCLMYTCSSSCGGFRWDMSEWNKLAMHLQRSCIWGRGGGGYVQKQPGGKHEAFVYRTGLTHTDAMNNLLTPPLVC